MRKIIQISTSVAEKSQENLVIALCNDRSVWEMGNSNKWNKLAEIPQDGYIEEESQISIEEYQEKKYGKGLGNIQLLHTNETNPPQGLSSSVIDNNFSSIQSKMHDGFLTDLSSSCGEKLKLELGKVYESYELFSAGRLLYVGSNGELHIFFNLMDLERYSFTTAYFKGKVYMIKFSSDQRPYWTEK